MYNYDNIVIEQSERAKINSEILEDIQRQPLFRKYSQEYVFNRYTGRGGLHGLKESDFRNYSEYRNAKQKFEIGQFFTPAPICKFITELLHIEKEALVGDLTCGMGNFFNFLPDESNIYGCEIEHNAYLVAKFLYPNAHIECNDIQSYKCPVTLDYIILNPPFNLNWQGSKSQTICIKKSFEALKNGGILVVVVPKTYLEDDFSSKSERMIINSKFSFLAQFELNADTFNNVGVKSFSTKIMLFQKKTSNITSIEYSNTYCTKEDFINAINRAKEKTQNVRAKIILENKRNIDKDFEYKYKKYLYHIKANPKLKEKSNRFENNFERFLTQEKPPTMEVKEWDKIKMTENRVLNPMKKALNRQHIIPEDVIRLVKTDYGLKYKAYSKKALERLNKTDIKADSFNDMILNQEYPFADNTYKKLFERKLKEYLQQSTEFNKIIPDKSIGDFLNNLVIHDYSDNSDKKLNNIQKEDIARVLTKKYAILNWSMGSGKSLAAISYAKYLLENRLVKNIFIISHALAINNSWCKILGDYVLIKKPEDIKKIKDGDIVLASFHYLAKNRSNFKKLYKKHSIIYETLVKKKDKTPDEIKQINTIRQEIKNNIPIDLKQFIKERSQKVALIFDESDEITSDNTRKTRSILEIFRRVKYKLLTTGTITRNSISEMYKQFELLYNNSVNFLCECEVIYIHNKKENIIRQAINPDYMKPFGAKGGMTLFKKSFNPLKRTVFCVEKNNQDIYNADKLAKLISKTVITKTFKDIVGANKYSFKNTVVRQSESEKMLYEKILKDFHSMVYKYFTRNENSKKDGMLMIVRQLMTLIKATSTPQYFREYNGGMPNKMKKIQAIITSKPDEKFCIGCTFIRAVDEYCNLLSNSGRPVFRKTGKENTQQTAEIIKAFNECKNGILVCTQQSLKSAVNIPNCQNVIIESLQWNIPKILQFAFRFIRFNSPNKAVINFVTYKDSIEPNLLGLLICKEKLNEFVKTLEFNSDDSLYQEYGIGENLLDLVIQKCYDKDGKYYLEWGKQMAA